MKTIEERAKEYAKSRGDISLSKVYNQCLANIYEEAYIAGAKEWKEIYMNKAFKYFEEALQCGVHPCSKNSFIMGFQKAMEEQVMSTIEITRAARCKDCKYYEVKRLKTFPPCRG